MSKVKVKSLATSCHISCYLTFISSVCGDDALDSIVPETAVKLVTATRLCLCVDCQTNQ